MAKYLPKAEQMFQEKLKAKLAPIGYVYDLGGSWNTLGNDGEILVRHSRLEWFDFKAVEELFFQYGNYLLLIEDPDDVQTSADA